MPVSSREQVRERPNLLNIIHMKPNVPYSTAVGQVLDHKFINGLQIRIIGHTANGIKCLESTLNKIGRRTKEKQRFYNKFDLIQMFQPHA